MRYRVSGYFDVIAWTSKHKLLVTSRYKYMLVGMIDIFMENIYIYYVEVMYRYLYL